MCALDAVLEGLLPLNRAGTTATGKGGWRFDALCGSRRVEEPGTTHLRALVTLELRRRLTGGAGALREDDSAMVRDPHGRARSREW